jgi:hypothetical protein
MRKTSAKQHQNRNDTCVARELPAAFVARPPCRPASRCCRRQAERQPVTTRSTDTCHTDTTPYNIVTESDSHTTKTHQTHKQPDSQTPRLYPSCWVGDTASPVTCLRKKRLYACERTWKSGSFGCRRTISLHRTRPAAIWWWRNMRCIGVSVVEARVGNSSMRTSAFVYIA